MLTSSSTLEPTCLVCCKSIKNEIVTETIPPNSAVILSDLLKLFCKWTANVDLDTNSTGTGREAIPNNYTFDFTKEPFPFCGGCKLKVMKMFQLNEELELIQNQIRKLSSTFAGIIMQSTESTVGSPGSFQSNKRLSKNSSVNFPSHSNSTVIEGLHRNFYYGESTRKKIHGIRELVRKCYQVKVALPRVVIRGKDVYIHESPFASSVSPTRAKRDSPSKGIRGKPENDLFPEDLDLVQYYTEVEVETEPITPAATIGLDANGEMDESEIQQQDGEIEFENDATTIDSDQDFVPSPGGPANEFQDVNKRFCQRVGTKGQGLPSNRRKFFPLTINRVVESSPNQFIYGNKYRFEKLEDGTFNCGSCNFSHARNDRMLHHIRYSHCYASRFVCETCGESFTVHKLLEKHKKIHENTNGEESGESTLLRYPCQNPKCGRSFKSSSALSFHRTHHNCNNDYQYECDEPGCRRKLFSPAHLEEHKKVHSRPYKCHLCPKTFGYKKGFNHHLKIHSGTQSHSCPQCDRKFPRQYKLRDHMLAVHRSSLPIRPRSYPRKIPILFRCNECDKVCKSQQLLDSHQKKHNKQPYKSAETSKQNQYSCDMCTKTFKSAKNLKGHKIVHTDDMPFSCSHCGKKTRSRKNLNSHIRAVHPDATEADTIEVEKEGEVIIHSEAEPTNLEQGSEESLASI